MRSQMIWSLYKREMLDIFRDKKAVFMNIFIPIILYPLITILATQVFMFVNTSMDEKTYLIAVSEEVKGGPLYAFLQREETKERDKKVEPSSEQLVAGDAPVYFELKESKNLREDLENKVIDLYIEEDEEGGGYKLHYISSVVNSRTALRKAESLMEVYQEEVREEKIRQLGGDAEDVLHSASFEASDHSTKEQSMGSLLGGLIPFFLVMGLVGGAIHTAIDVSVGEKERGTLETLFSLPVTSKEVLYGKFFAVATMAVISVILNFVSMSLMGAYFYKLMSETGNDMAQGFRLAEFIPVMSVVLLCIILFAVFITAVSLTLFFFSKSVKEAQNYAMPLGLIVSLISYIGFIPNMELTWKTALLPVANVVLLVKSAFQFQFHLPLMMGVLASNLLYGLLTMSFMTGVFDKEEMMFEEDIHFIRLFERRSNLKKGGVPMVAEAIFLLVVGLAALIFVGTYAQLKFGFYGILLTQFCIMALPLGFALYTRCDLKKTFSLKLPKLGHIVGSVFLWMGTFMLVMVLSLLLQEVFPESYENLEQMNRIFEGRSLLSMILVVALAPAVCEEIFFRGYIFSAFRQKRRVFVAVIITSVFFGVFHMSLVKFFTTTILGISLNYALYRSDSIVTSSLMHFLNNTTAVAALYVQRGKGGAEVQMEAAEQLTRPQFIVFGVLILLLISIGVFLLRSKEKKEEPTSS
ncbi:MAG: ABC transporter permease subunit/CPBP intramembrane protease [Filifactor alocis]|nr:ABC transporter permease subunit/CPBP intramembrane protease [Filifactor alocis]